jgi:formiminoglutamase
MFTPADASLFFTKNDAEDPRLGDWFKPGQDPGVPHSWALMGYCDDSGIRMNGGRPGAAQAPTQIRKSLYKMTPAAARPAGLQFQDLGNLESHAVAGLADRHGLAMAHAEKCLRAGQRLITLGGGHDYGYPDAAAFLKTKTTKPLVLNFDAHLDVRPTDKGFHSGTPFRRLLQEFKGAFEFVEIGIQPQCNSLAHADWARAQGAKILTLQELRAVGLVAWLRKNIQWSPDRDVWLSLDMDSFSAAYAPGCSQVFATGLFPDEILQALDFVSAHAKAAGLGIYETSPDLDIDDQTSKLAALCVHRMLFPMKA